MGLTNSHANGLICTTKNVGFYITFFGILATFEQAKLFAAYRVEDARGLLAAHAERRAEIDSRQAELAALREFGHQIVAEQSDHRAEVQRAHRRLQNVEHQIRQSWEQENTALHRALELQTLFAQLLHAESWLGTKEAFVADYGEPCILLADCVFAC